MPLSTEGTVIDIVLCDEGAADGYNLKKQDKIEKYAKQFEELGLSKDQRLIIDRLLSANNESNYRYSELAYMQGFKDCVELLKTIDLIKV